MKLFLAALFLLMAAACAPRTGPGPVRGPLGNPLTVEADFDDIEPAVAGVLPRFRMIEVPKPTGDPAVRRFVLQGLDDTPGTLVFTRLPDGRIEIAASIGRFGEPEREERLVGALAHRLRRLRGDVAAPLD